MMDFSAVFSERIRLDALPKLLLAAFSVSSLAHPLTSSLRMLSPLTSRSTRFLHPLASSEESISLPESFNSSRLSWVPSFTLASATLFSQLISTSPVHLLKFRASTPLPEACTIASSSPSGKVMLSIAVLSAFNSARRVRPLTSRAPEIAVSCQYRPARLPAVSHLYCALSRSFDTTSPFALNAPINCPKTCTSCAFLPSVCNRDPGTAVCDGSADGAADGSVDGCALSCGPLVGTTPGVLFPGAADDVTPGAADGVVPGTADGVAAGAADGAVDGAADVVTVGAAAAFTVILQVSFTVPI